MHPSSGLCSPCAMGFPDFCPSLLHRSHWRALCPHSSDGASLWPLSVHLRLKRTCKASGRHPGGLWTQPGPLDLCGASFNLY